MRNRFKVYTIVNRDNTSEELYEIHWITEFDEDGEALQSKHWATCDSETRATIIARCLNALDEAVLITSSKESKKND